MKVVKNDNVLVIGGNYQGKKGKILKVFPRIHGVLLLNFSKIVSEPMISSFIYSSLFGGRSFIFNYN